MKKLYLKNLLFVGHNWNTIMAHACLDHLDDDVRIDLMSKNARLQMLNYDNTMIKKNQFLAQKDF